MIHSTAQRSPIESRRPALAAAGSPYYDYDEEMQCRTHILQTKLSDGTRTRKSQSMCRPCGQRLQSKEMAASTSMMKSSGSRLQVVNGEAEGVVPVVGIEGTSDLVMLRRGRLGRSS